MCERICSDQRSADGRMAPGVLVEDKEETGEGETLKGTRANRRRRISGGRGGEKARGGDADCCLDENTEPSRRRSGWETRSRVRRLLSA